MSVAGETVQQRAPRKQATVHLDRALYRKIEQLSALERRSFSQQAEVLIQEALDARSARDVA